LSPNGARSHSSSSPSVTSKSSGSSPAPNESPRADVKMSSLPPESGGAPESAEANAHTMEKPDGQDGAAGIEAFAGDASAPGRYAASSAASAGWRSRSFATRVPA
jgi:hypothetical protein